MKKTIALMLALVMLFALAACGTPAAEEKPYEQEEFYANASYKDIIKNGFGDSRWDGSLPLVPEGEEVTIKIGIPTNAMVLDYETNSYTTWLEEQTGLNIEIVEFAGSSSDIGTQLSLMLTGGEELPDIFTVTGLSNEAMKEYMQEGYILNLAGYMQTDAHYSKQAMERFYPDEQARADMMENIMFACGDPESEGVFSFPRIYNNPADMVANQIMINSDWLKAVGKEAPTNIEELYDVLVAFRNQDPNGNGKKDEIPMIGMVGRRGRGIDCYVMNAFTYYVPHVNPWQVEDGKLQVVYTQDEYREGLKFLNKLIKEGLLSELSLNLSSNDLQALLDPEEGEPFTVGIVAAWIDVNHSERSVFAYEPIPPLADATGKGGWGPWELDVAATSLLIHGQCEHPDIAFRLLDFMAGGESYMRQRWGEKGVDWDDLPEGYVAEGNGMFGGTARFITLKDNVLSTTGNTMWHEQYALASEGYYQMYLDPNATDYQAEVYKKLWKNSELQRAAGNPEETFQIFWRTSEEDDALYEYSAELSGHFSKCRSEFIKGIRDPYDDAQWEEYLNELDALHLQENYIDIAQASYERSKAN